MIQHFFRIDPSHLFHTEIYGDSHPERSTVLVSDQVENPFKADKK